MRTLMVPRPVRAALAVCALAASASAQGLVDARAALSNFPESQAVVFVNARRITHEVLPRVVPKADYDRMMAEARKVGFDVRDIDYLAAGLRFTGESQSGVPEFLVVLRGRFSADALITLGRIAASTQNLRPREEIYGNKPIQVFDLAALDRKEEAGADGQGENQGDGPKPKPLPFKEVAAAALDPNTLVFGVPGYVRAAVDAAGGRGRLSASLLDLAARDPQALWSLTADVPENLMQHAQKLGIPPNEEASRILGWLRRVSFSNGWDALNLTLRAAVLTDSPEHANAIGGLVRMGLTAAESAAREDIERKRRRPRESREAQMALKALRTFVTRTEGSTVVLGASIPQSAVAEFVRREFVKKPAGPTTSRRRARRR